MSEIWFEHEGTRLFAVERGSGFPIILLHGGLADHRACWQFAAPLAERFRVITPDLRASGRSQFAGALDFDRLAGDVAALARHLGISRAAIGGTSFGAACAVRVALRHPALTAALVVLHPAFAGADVGLAPAQQAAMDAMNASGQRTLAEGIHALDALFAPLPAAIRDRAAAMIASFDPASVAATTAFLASGAQPFATAADLAAITAPVLLVPGTDPTHPPELAELYRRHLPHATVRTVDAPWHTADLASPIAAFLDGLT